MASHSYHGEAFYKGFCVSVSLTNCSLDMLTTLKKKGSFSSEKQSTVRQT